MRILAGKQGGYRGKATFNPLLITECQLLYFCFVRLCGLQKSDLPVLSVVLILAPGILCEGEKNTHTQPWNTSKGIQSRTAHWKECTGVHQRQFEKCHVRKCNAWTQTKWIKFQRNISASECQGSSMLLGHFAFLHGVSKTMGKEPNSQHFITSIRVHRHFYKELENNYFEHNIGLP